MTIVQINEIREELIEKLNTNYNSYKAPIEIKFCKNLLAKCPNNEDIRSIIDTYFDIVLINNGYKYISNVSNSNELVFFKYDQIPCDYTEIRFLNKLSLLFYGCNPNCIDQKYTLYYDETNNVKKFRIKEDKNKFNVPADTIFVLGGIAAEDIIDFEELKKIFKLQPNAKEIKSHHIYEGNFSDCLKSDRLESFLDLLLSKKWYIHFSSLNVLYWSIVDILDSIDNFEKDEQYLVLKAIFYRIMKNDLHGFYDIVLKYRYPNIKAESIESFMQDLINMCDCYHVSNYVMEYLKNELIQWLNKGKYQKKAVFIQDEKELEMLSELSNLYRSEIAIWLNSQIIFDNESDIIFELKRKPVMINNSFVSNFTFIDSKKNIMVQLSDVAIGITSKYLSFIDNEVENVPYIVENIFDEKQLRIFKKLNNILKLSRDHNPAFFHQITSIEIHGLLNKYIDKYGI